MVQLPGKLLLHRVLLQHSAYLPLQGAWSRASNLLVRVDEFVLRPLSEPLQLLWQLPDHHHPLTAAIICTRRQG